ncbi:MAG: hypothetical protein D6785_03715 [Planctomycetota bacterium]|nr:MAG: hypothetical protein D6785_03715 [Planctomycetota bacterium]
MTPHPTKPLVSGKVTALKRALTIRLLWIQNLPLWKRVILGAGGRWISNAMPEKGEILLEPLHMIIPKTLLSQ